MITTRTHYTLTYDVQGCIDRGYIGHDSGWLHNYRHVFEAESHEEALSLAEKFIQDRKPCGAFDCDNRGLKSPRHLEYVTLTIERPEGGPNKEITERTAIKDWGVK